MDLKGYQAIELVPGANTYVTPKEEDPGPPPGFVDNTVYRYRMVNGVKVPIGTMPAFPEGWDRASEFNKSIKEEKGESEDMASSNIDNWPEIIACGLELLENGQSLYKASAQLVEEFKLSVTPQSVYPKLKKAAEEKAKELNQGEPPRQAATINTDFENCLKHPLTPGEPGDMDFKEDKSDPNIWQKVCRHCGAVLGEEKYFYKGWLCPSCFKSEIQLSPLGPAEEIKPISAPYGVEIPKGEDQLSQYTPDDNDFSEEGNELNLHRVMNADRLHGLLQICLKPDLGPTKIQLIATLLAEFRDGAIDANVVLGLTRGILDLQLPEVG